jgi:hypothetical protein
VLSMAADVFTNPFPPGYWASVFDTAHGLASVNDLLASRMCYGVSRYRTGSGDYPALSLTVSWGRSGVWVERLSAFISLDRVPQQVGPASAWSAWVPRHLLPTSLRQWPAALSTFVAAPSVDRLAGMDGFLAHHSWAGPEGNGETEWVWPDQRDRNQLRLIGSYQHLILAAWFCSWLSVNADRGISRTKRST